MEKEEYIIINKTKIQKRIEELKKELLKLKSQFNECYRKNNASYTQALLKERHPDWKQHKLSCLNEIAILQQILSQSTPLIPELEKVYDVGRSSFNSALSYEECKEDYYDYISNLKLDI